MSELKNVNSLKDYLNDRDRVSEEVYQQIVFEAELIGKIIEARENNGFTQRDLAEKTGLKQSAIARLESRKTLPRIDTVIKLLAPLGYKLSIEPIISEK